MPSPCAETSWPLRRNRPIREFMTWTSVDGPTALVTSPGDPAVSLIPTHCCNRVGVSGSARRVARKEDGAPSAPVSDAIFAWARPAEGGMPGVYPRKVAEDDATARCGNGAEVDRPR